MAAADAGATHVDLNCDLGEGFGPWRVGDDTSMLEIVSSANVACGFHAGDPSTMFDICRAAARRGVAVGAHVGYRDLVGFGRRFLDVAYDDLVPDLLYQMGALDSIARSAGTRVSHVKPHGALYLALDTQPTQVSALLEALGTFGASLPLVGRSGSGWLAAAETAGFPTVREAFADRAYAPDGSLARRGVPGAVLDDADLIAGRCVEMVREGRVRTLDGSMIAIEPESICVHGDTPGAPAIAAAVADRLRADGVTIATFAA